MARRVSISFPTRYYDPDNPVSGEGSSALNNNNYGVTHPPNPDFMGSNDDFREDRNCSNGAREQENDALDPIALPQSTHTLLFTQPVFSLPFGFAVFILLMCLLSLLLCLIDRIYSEGIPANVTPTVRTAQFLAIFIAILVEEGKCVMTGISVFWPALFCIFYNNLLLLSIIILQKYQLGFTC